MLCMGGRLRKAKSTLQLQPAANPPAQLGLNLELDSREHYFGLHGAATTGLRARFLLVAMDEGPSRGGAATSPRPPAP